MSISFLRGQEWSGPSKGQREGALADAGGSQERGVGNSVKFLVSQVRLEMAPEFRHMEVFGVNDKRSGWDGS